MRRLELPAKENTPLVTLFAKGCNRWTNRNSEYLFPSRLRVLYAHRAVFALLLCYSWFRGELLRCCRSLSAELRGPVADVFFIRL